MIPVVERSSSSAGVNSELGLKLERGRVWRDGPKINVRMQLETVAYGIVYIHHHVSYIKRAGQLDGIERVKDTTIESEPGTSWIKA